MNQLPVVEPWMVGLVIVLTVMTVSYIMAHREKSGIRDKYKDYRIK